MAVEQQSAVRLQSSQEGRAAETLTSAFRDDPLFAYLIPNDARRLGLARLIHRSSVRYGLLYGEVHVRDRGARQCSEYCRAHAGEVHGIYPLGPASSSVGPQGTRPRECRCDPRPLGSPRPTNHARRGRSAAGRMPGRGGADGTHAQVPEATSVPSACWTPQFGDSVARSGRGREDLLASSQSKSERNHRGHGRGDDLGAGGLCDAGRRRHPAGINELLAREIPVGHV